VAGNLRTFVGSLGALPALLAWRREPSRPRAAAGGAGRAGQLHIRGLLGARGRRAGARRDEERKVGRAPASACATLACVTTRRLLAQGQRRANKP